MKKCPYCAEEIQDEAIVCRFCSRELAPPSAAATSTSKATPVIESKRSKKSAAIALLVGVLLVYIGGAAAGLGFFALLGGFVLSLPGGMIMRLGGAFLASLVVFAILFTPAIDQVESAALIPPSSAASADAARPAPEPEERLELLSTRGYESEYGGYHIVEGQVKNLTAAPLKSIQVVATWFSEDGTMITSDDALIEYNPLMPAQSSPFKTMSRTNPLMKRYTVTFKEFWGPTISTRDSRKR